MNYFRYEGKPKYDSLIYYYTSGENTAPQVDKLTIDVFGTCEIESTGIKHGIYFSDHNMALDIVGSGDLYLYAGTGICNDYLQKNQIGDGINVNEITVDLDGSLYVYGQYAQLSSRGISCYSLTVNRGSVYAYGGKTVTHSYHGTITSDEAVGILCTRLIVNKGKVYAEGGDAVTTCYGIRGSYIEVNEGKVNATAQTKMSKMMADGHAVETYNAFYGVGNVAYGEGGYAKISNYSNFSPYFSWKSSDDNAYRYIEVYSTTPVEY